jgi:hypothetical protein
MTTAEAFSPAPVRRCPCCGAECTAPFCVACGADEGGLRLSLAEPSAEVRALLPKLNAGAALLPGIWPFAHGAPVLGVLWWLLAIPLPPVAIGIMVYLLFNGNRIALQRRLFASPEQFRAVERRWTIAAFIVLPFALLFLFVAFVALFSLLYSLGAQGPAQPSTSGSP